MAAKIAKNCNFCINLPLKTVKGSIEKLEYRCTTRNLPLCNGTITVLKITLLHGVSVITNFVIRIVTDRQTDRTRNTRRQCNTGRLLERFWRKFVFRSTSESRPNSIEGKNVRPPVRTSVRPSVRPYVRPSVHKKFLQLEWNSVYR